MDLVVGGKGGRLGFDVSHDLPITCGLFKAKTSLKLDIIIRVERMFEKL